MLACNMQMTPQYILTAKNLKVTEQNLEAELKVLGTTIESN